jgi:hypothetical protein
VVDKLIVRPTPTRNPMAKNNAEHYLEYLTATFGEESRILREDGVDGGPPISMFVYEGAPEPGMITGVTFGLSLVANPAWTQSRPEMLISMESGSLDWPSVAANLTAYFSRKKRFSYGDVFTVDGPLTEDTEMDALLIFAQSLLEPEHASVDLRDYRVHLSQFYPFYRSEIELYERIGLQAFWNHPDFGMYDPRRPRIQ